MLTNFQIGFWILNILLLATSVYISGRTAVKAVRVGRELNNEKQKDDAKRNLFLTLFALRGKPLDYAFVKALNEIDVVFEDTPTVLDAWHKHYDSLEIPGRQNEKQIWELERIELLSAMAMALGYNKIRQTDMIREYYPEGHYNQSLSDFQYKELKTKLYQSSIETNKLLTVQIKQNLGLLNDPEEEDQPSK